LLLGVRETRNSQEKILRSKLAITTSITVVVLQVVV
jgi:hypothetical protein